MSSVIKISSQQFRAELCSPTIPDSTAWILLFKRNASYSFAFYAFGDLESAKQRWRDLLEDDKLTPLFIQATPWHHPFVPKEWFNCSGGFR